MASAAAQAASARSTPPRARWVRASRWCACRSWGSRRWPCGRPLPPRPIRRPRSARCRDWCGRWRSRGGARRRAPARHGPRRSVGFRAGGCRGCCAPRHRWAPPRSPGAAAQPPRRNGCNGSRRRRRSAGRSDPPPIPRQQLGEELVRPVRAALLHVARGAGEDVCAGCARIVHTVAAGAGRRLPSRSPAHCGGRPVRAVRRSLDPSGVAALTTGPCGPSALSGRSGRR